MGRGERDEDAASFAVPLARPFGTPAITDLGSNLCCETAGSAMVHLSDIPATVRLPDPHVQAAILPVTWASLTYERLFERTHKGRR